MSRASVSVLTAALSSALLACESPAPPSTSSAVSAPSATAEAPVRGGRITPGTAEQPLPRPTAAAAAEPEIVAAQHLLVQYKGAKQVARTVTRSKADAKKRAEEALAKARKGDDFSALVKEYSDEPGAADRQGSLGKFKREAMVKPFADAAFALEVGKISDVVETDFGFHVIKRNQ